MSKYASYLIQKRDAALVARNEKLVRQYQDMLIRAMAPRRPTIITRPGV